MPRIEEELMTGWEFLLGESEEGIYRSIYLPHDWAIEAPFRKDMQEGAAQGYQDRWGIGWYKRNLCVKEKKKGYQYYLSFGGIFEKSTIWINGQFVGGHQYGYSSFEVEITQALQVGDNQILIKVDNSTGPADRWYSGCGIYRTVKLITVEEIHLCAKDIFVTTKVEQGDAVVTVDVGHVIDDKMIQDGYQYKLELCECRNASVKKDDSYIQQNNQNEKENGQVISLQSTEQVVCMHVGKPKLWSIENPNLYRLQISIEKNNIVVDQISMNIGIKTVNMMPDQGMLVNGTPVKLNGVCLHQEVGCRGVAAKKEVIRKRLENLKEMGCNAIRAAHHTFSEEFLELCDEMGFYVYEECFDKWTGGSYGRYFKTDWQQDVESMVLRDRNHPCIVIWGVGNEVENQGQDSMLAILRMLTDKVKQMDCTRPVTYAMNPHFKRESRIDISTVTDIQKFVDEEDDTEIYDAKERVERISKIADIVDIISCNYQEQWYELIHEKCPDKLILGTETYQYFKGDYNQMQNFTEENPALVPTKHPYVIGSMIWSGYDYLGESMGYPAKGWSGAPIRTNGERKPSYYMLQSYYSDKPMVHFSVMDYSLQDEGVKEHWDMPIYADHWHFPQFHKTVIPYMITSNCEEVALYLNDKRFYISKPSACPNRFLTGFLPYQPGTVKVVGFIHGREVCSYETVTPGQAVQLAFSEETETAYLPITNGYEALFTIKAFDENKHFYFRESSYVHFVIEGEAEIIGVDNGNLMGNEPYCEDGIHMYHGCASVMVRFLSDHGTVKLSAYAEGLQCAHIVIVSGDM